MDPEGHRGESTALDDVATTLVHDAEERAALLLEEAAGRSLLIHEQAYTEGYAAGDHDGRIAAREEVLGALAVLQAAGREAHALRDEIVRGAEREILELSLEVAHAVVGDAARASSAVAIEVLDRALARTGALNVLRIRVHPADRDALTAHLAETRGDAAAHWELLPDGTITVGGCVIDVEGGEIDARLDVQLEQIARALRELANEANEEQRHAA